MIHGGGADEYWWEEGRCKVWRKSGCRRVETNHARTSRLFSSAPRFFFASSSLHRAPRGGAERVSWLLALVFACLLYWRLCLASKDLCFRRQPPKVPAAIVWHPLQQQQLPRGGQLLGYTHALDQPLEGAQLDLTERKSTSSDIERLIRTLSTGKTFTQGERIRMYLNSSFYPASRLCCAD